MSANRYYTQLYKKGNTMNQEIITISISEFIRLIEKTASEQIDDKGHYYCLLDGKKTKVVK